MAHVTAREQVSMFCCGRRWVGVDRAHCCRRTAGCGHVFDDVALWERHRRRRSSSYGPMLPEGVLEDDGADHGILFFCLQANLTRGFEFVKSQWINEGTFIGMPSEMDPLVGPNDETRMFTVPQQPIRRRLTQLPQFVVNRGGEYLFMPGRRALGWIAGLDS